MSIDHLSNHAKQNNKHIIFRDKKTQEAELVFCPSFDKFSEIEGKLTRYGIDMVCLSCNEILDI